MKLMDMIDLEELRIDNVDGWGAVPYNQNVDYMGLRVKMKPSVFLKLAHTLTRYPSSKDIEQHIKADGGIGAPFLVINIPVEWFDNGDFTKPAEVYGHEGRNRMAAVKKVEGDNPIETHLFFAKQLRNRDLTPEIISHLNKEILSQEHQLIQGPWFSEFKPGLSEDTKSFTGLINRAQKMFDKGFVFDALATLDDSNISTKNPELRTLFANNIQKIAEYVLQDIVDPGNKYHKLSSTLNFLKSNWFLMDNLEIVPNNIISNVLNNNKTQIIKRLSSKLSDEDSLGDLVMILEELEYYWEVNIDLNDVIDLNKNKIFVLKSLMSLIKEHKNYYTSRILKYIKRSNIQWPELAIISKKIVESDNDEDTELVNEVKHCFQQGRAYDAMVAVDNAGENINYYRELSVLFDKNIDKVVKLILDNINNVNTLRHFRDILDSIGFHIPNNVVMQYLYNNESKIIDFLSDLILENLSKTRDLLDELEEWGMDIDIGDVIDLDDNKAYMIKSILSLIKNNRISDAKYFISKTYTDWPELDIIKKQLYAKHPAIRETENQTDSTELRAVQANPYLIRQIENPSKEVQLVAVNKNGQIIKDIIEKGIVPSLEVQLAAVKNWPFSINYILANKIEVQPEVKRLILKLLIDFCKIGGEPVVAMSLYDLLMKHHINWPELETIRKYLYPSDSK